VKIRGSLLFNILGCDKDHISVRPSIQTSPVKSLTVKEGEEARLYCRVVAGNPKPKLKWRRKGDIMPTGDEEIMGEVIIFESVTRHYEGTYECVTEDDYGFEPITRKVQLHVECKCLHKNANQLKIAISHFRCPGH
jgi:hypothetical protein